MLRHSSGCRRQVSARYRPTAIHVDAEGGAHIDTESLTLMTQRPCGRERRCSSAQRRHPR
eukprot:248752-Alexandrium_andersonii.AAC.1